MSQNIRLSNFGGVGGQSNPFMPGGSPLFRGQSSGMEGYGINDFSTDSSLDDLMGGYRLSDGITRDEKPLESLLEIFHDNLENDAQAYILSPMEREKLKRKKKIRAKEQYLADMRMPQEHSKKNTVEEKFETVENLLEEFRQNNNVDFSKNASSDRVSGFRRTPITPIKLDERYLTTEEEWDNNPLAKARLTEPFTGIVPQYELGEGVDEYIEALNNPTFPDIHNGANANLNINYEMEVYKPHVYKVETIDNSPITEDSKNNNQSLESKLEKLKKSYPNLGRLDPGMFYGIDWDEKIHGRYPERGVVNNSPYRNDTMGGTATNGYPQTSNNPYFGVIN